MKRAIGILSILTFAWATGAEWVRPADAQEIAHPIRRGLFQEITDALGSEYHIKEFRMARNGQAAAFLVLQSVKDGRDCYARQLRYVFTDGTGERVIEQGFTYDTGVGNNCAHGLSECFDISNDGTKVAYLRYDNPTDRKYEIVVYNVLTEEKTVVAKTLNYSSYGEAKVGNLDPQAQFENFKMSGNGNAIWFVNRYGPWGEPGSSGDPGPSGFTLYRVEVGNSPVPMFSDMHLAELAGGHAGAVHVTASGGYIDSNNNGNFCTLPTGGNFPSGNPFRQLLLITPGTPPGNARILLQSDSGYWSGASMSGAASYVSYVRTGTGDNATNGLFIQSTNAIDPAVQIDPGWPDVSRFPTKPFISRDASSISYTFELGGGTEPSSRMARIGEGPIPISSPVIRPASKFTAINIDGTAMMMLGEVCPTSYYGTSFIERPDLVYFQWVPDGIAVDPQINLLAGDPVLWLDPRDQVSAPDDARTWYYNASGTQLGNLYPWAWFYPARDLHISGMENIVTDAAEGFDVAAGDGTYTDGYHWLQKYHYDRMAGQTPLVRASVGTHVDRAAIADFPIEIRPLAAGEDSNYVKPGDSAPIDTGDVGVVLDFIANETGGYVYVQRFEDTPEDLADAAALYWSINGLEEGTFETYITFTYDEAILAAAGIDENDLQLMYRSSDGLTWFILPAVVDTEANTITTIYPVDSFSLFALMAKNAETVKWRRYN